MIDIKDIQTLAADIDNIIMTKHMRKRLKERGILFDDVHNVLLK